MKIVKDSNTKKQISKQIPMANIQAWF